MEKWCKNQIPCEEDIRKGTFTCMANLAERRASVCPYTSFIDRLRATYPCPGYEKPNQKKWEHFSNDELYMLKRQAIESSYEIVMTEKYNSTEIQIHNKLLNEIIDEIKYRK